MWSSNKLLFEDQTNTGHEDQKLVSALVQEGKGIGKLGIV